LNIIFWLIVASMLLLALLFVVLPLISKKEFPKGDDVNQRNIQIARDRLAELKANKAIGGISEAHYEEQVAELELTLSDDLGISEPSSQTKAQGRWLAYVLIVAVPLLSITLYGLLGDYQAIGRANDPTQNAEAQTENPEMPSPEAINNMVAKLADKLKNDPDNLEGWVMLGKSYKVLERHADAVKAYERAYQLAQDNADVILPYAEAITLASGGNWAGKPMELVQKVLKREPGHVTALWFAAVANAQQDDKKTALVYLRKLVSVLPENSQDKHQIEEIIANTEKQLSGKLLEPAMKAQNQAVKMPGLTVEVSIAPGFKSRVKPETAVFIYAQALSGPKMPLAIVRKQVSDLPLSVSLSDADGMMPNLKLSAFKQVKLLARVSSSGNAMPQPGDLLGVIETVDTGDKERQVIEINQEVK